MSQPYQPRHFFPIVALLWLALTTATVAVASEGYVRIENRWKPTEQLNVETGTLASSPAQPGWHSADWLLEPVGDGVHVRIKNRWKGAYINNCRGDEILEATATKPNGASLTDSNCAMWQLEPVDSGFYRLKNREIGDYIHIENGQLALGNAAPGWYSAMWKLQGYTPVGMAEGKTAPPPATRTMAQPSPDDFNATYFLRKIGGQDPRTEILSLRLEQGAPWPRQVNIKRTQVSPTYYTLSCEFVMNNNKVVRGEGHLRKGPDNTSWWHGVMSAAPDPRTLIGLQDSPPYTVTMVFYTQDFKSFIANVSTVSVASGAGFIQTGEKAWSFDRIGGPTVKSDNDD